MSKQYRTSVLLDCVRLLIFFLIDATVKLDIFQSDPFFSNHRNNIVTTDYFFSLSGQIVDAQLHIG